MVITLSIESERPLSFKKLAEDLCVDDLVLVVSPEELPDTWGFFRKNHSSTLFTIWREDGMYNVSMDRLASYDDYRFFPYLVDTLNVHLTGKPYLYDNVSIFDLMDEEWAIDTISETIAHVKSILALGLKFPVEYPLYKAALNITNEALAKVGVCVYSSTPRISGYIAHLLQHNLLPEEDELYDITDDMLINALKGVESVEVPQHASIGTVRSWQTDGEETTESYCEEDVALLMGIAEAYKQGKTEVEGVVLNDIGTIHEHGIGIKRDAEGAVFWYGEAIKRGDLLYAPTNLGDIYRKGLDTVEKDLGKAVEAYRISTDPYATYRLGQSFEEGWTAEPDLEKAMTFYRVAADAGHHLAIKRLKREAE